jgi:endo-1,4-beta-xylanase
MTAQKLEEIDHAIEDYKALKLKVAITELDLTIGISSGAGRGLCETVCDLSEAPRCHRPSPFWGLNDRRSWRASQSPLIFDRENQAKPALQAILSVAAG